MNFGVQALVLRVVRGLGEAVSCRPVALAHRGLALVVNLCRDTDGSGRGSETLQHFDRCVKCCVAVDHVCQNVVHLVSLSRFCRIVRWKMFMKCCFLKRVLCNKRPSRFAHYLSVNLYVSGNVVF